MDGRGDTNGPKDTPTIDDDAVDQRLGETVRLLRQRAGLSIQDVANRTGLSNGMISQLERARAMPSIRTLRLLSIALDVPISYFFETSDPSRRSALHRTQEQPAAAAAHRQRRRQGSPDAGRQGPARTLRAHAQSRRLVRHRLPAAHRREGRLYPVRQPAAVARQPGPSARGRRQLPLPEHRAPHVRQSHPAGGPRDLGDDAAADRSARRLKPADPVRRPPHRKIHPRRRDTGSL